MMFVVGSWRIIAEKAVAERDALQAERDALQAEVEQLRSVLPKWRKVPWLDDQWELRIPPDQGSSIGVCRLSDGWRHQHQSERAPPYASRDEAMRAAEAKCGLPICEVVNG